MTTHPASADVLRAIREEDVVALALELGQVDSPAGHEADAGDAVYSWMDDAGLAPRRLGLTRDRFNVVGVIPGSGAGRSVAFNSHLDTSVAAGEQWSTRHAADPIYHTAWRDGRLLRGNGVCNDKGQMACWMVAAKAVRDVVGQLSGDVVLTAACGEIELEPVDEFEAPEYLSRETGTRYAIARGAIADLAIVAEATGFGIGWVEAGSAFFKVSVFGAEPPQYNPFVTGRGAAGPNAIVRLAALITALEGWAEDYERRHRWEGEGGTVVPRINVGAARGGLPYKITKTAQVATAYVDARLTPQQSALEVRRELLDFARSVDVSAEVELFSYRRGFEAEGVEPYLPVIEAAHAAVHDRALERCEPTITSMWRDLNPYAEAGIPCVMYGPGPTTGTGVMGIAIDDLVQAARAYALLALGVTAMPPTNESEEAKP